MKALFFGTICALGAMAKAASAVPSVDLGAGAYIQIVGVFLDRTDGPMPFPTSLTFSPPVDPVSGNVTVEKSTSLHETGFGSWSTTTYSSLTVTNHDVLNDRYFLNEYADGFLTLSPGITLDNPLTEQGQYSINIDVEDEFDGITDLSLLYSCATTVSSDTCGEPKFEKFAQAPHRIFAANVSQTYSITTTINASISSQITSVPEPSSILVLTIGLVSLGICWRGRRPRQPF
jgi:hypothetical protein